MDLTTTITFSDQVIRNRTTPLGGELLLEDVEKDLLIDAGEFVLDDVGQQVVGQ